MTALPDGEFQPPPGLLCACAILRGPIARAGYTVVREARAAITRPLNGRAPCHYCGRCGHGCDSGSKFTSVGALFPVAKATGRLTLITNAIVREVNLDRCHDVPNLILADGSIQCTSGITNPTLTILSLTMRNMSHLTEEVRKGSV